MFFSIFYFCCDFVFIIVNADVTFSFFSVKVCSNAFFCHKLLFFVVFIKMFLPAFFSCCNFVFLFLYYLRYFSPFVTERFLADFSTAFSPKTAYFLPFCDISLAVHVHCKKIPLVVLGNCRFILQFFL